MDVPRKPPPNCVDCAKLKVIFIAAAPSVGVKPGKFSAPLAGGVTAPVGENGSGLVVGSKVPLTVMLTFQRPGVAVCVKKKVAGKELPSESYTVVEVDWLYVAGLAGLNAPPVGGSDPAGKFRITLPAVGASGALCAVCKFKFGRAPVLHPPEVVGGETCSARPAAGR